MSEPIARTKVASDEFGTTSDDVAQRSVEGRPVANDGQQLVAIAADQTFQSSVISHAVHVTGQPTGIQSVETVAFQVCSVFLAVQLRFDPVPVACPPVEQCLHQV